MSIESQLIYQATNYARSHSSPLAQNRLATYVPKTHVRYNCFWCWIDHKRASVLEPIPGGTTEQEFFKCTTCKGEVAISM
jgi:hypothetical protein